MCFATIYYDSGAACSRIGVNKGNSWKLSKRELTCRHGQLFCAATHLQVLLLLAGMMGGNGTLGTQHILTQWVMIMMVGCIYVMSKRS